jgi:serine/threonine protein phosphatase 1
MPGRTIAIGDVHGCLTALNGVLEQIQPAKDDLLIFLGDVVDRGPATKECIDRVLELSEQLRVICLMGNHEEMMRDCLTSVGNQVLAMWLQVGGQPALDSYGGAVENIPQTHLRWLANLRNFYETDTEIFVHAVLEPNVSLANQTREFLRWKKLAGSERPHVSGKRVICGHTPQPDGFPLAFPGWVCIDTWVYKEKWLTALDVESNQVWQASEAGQQRTFDLAKYT